MPAQPAILVFAKLPLAGRVKTRLLGLLSPTEAAALHRACAADAIRLAAAAAGCSRSLLVAPDEAGRWRWPESDLSSRWMVRPQRGRNLGERLEQAFAEAFRRGPRKVLAIGTDTPWMGVRRLSTALAWLDSDDVVLGPAADGGYYLLAARRPIPALFHGIPWGSRRTLDATRSALECAGASYRLMPRDFDLDRPSDLAHARRLLAKCHQLAPHLAQWISGFDGEGLRGPDKAETALEE